MISYIPKSLDECAISDSKSALHLQKMLNGGIGFPGIMNGILLHGMPGTGKTTLAKELPKWFEAGGKLPPSGRGSDFHKMFSATDYIYETLCDSSKATTAAIKNILKRDLNDAFAGESGWHYEVLDELDALTKEGLMSLKSVMSKCKHTIFITTTNSPQLLAPALLDRMAMIEMNAAKPEQLLVPARNILQYAGFVGNEVDDATLLSLADSCSGSLRQFGQSALIAASVNLTP